MPVANRTIWAYWENRHSESMPEYLQLCLETIERQKGDAEFIMISPETITDYLPSSEIPENFGKLISAHKADYLRSTVLKVHGGMWVDVDTIALDRLDINVLDRLNEAPVVSYVPFSMAFFAARQGSEFVTEWSRQARELIEPGTPLYWRAIGAVITEKLSPNIAALTRPLHTYGWSTWEKFIQPGNPDTSKHLACILYNKELFPHLKDMTKDEVLAKDWALSSILRKALS